MKTRLILMVAIAAGGIPAVSASDTSAQQLRVVLPNCCEPAASFFTLNATTGQVQHVIAAGVQNTSGAWSDGLTILQNGQFAVISEIDPGDASQSFVLNIVNPATGASKGPLTIPGTPTDLGVNPASGALYSGYETTDFTRHLQEIDPTSWKVLQDVAVTGSSPGIFHGHMVFTPNGKEFFLQYGDTIYAYSTATLSQIASIPGPNCVLGASPDGSTLYAALTGTSEVFAIDLATFEITETVSISGLINDNGQAGIISTDGNKLFLNLTTSVATLDTATWTQQTTELPSGYLLEGMLPGANGTLPLFAFFGEDVEGLLFNYGSSSITGQFPVPGSRDVIQSSSGSALYSAGPSSAVAMLGADPSTVVQRTAAAGDLVPGQSKPFAGVYDSKDSLILIQDESFNVEVLSATTLAFKGMIPVFEPGPIAYNNSAFIAVVTPSADGESITAQVLELDPTSLAVKNTIGVPVPSGDNLGVFYQMASSAKYLYIPYNFQDECICDDTSRSGGAYQSGIAVIDTEASTLSANFRSSQGGVYGFAIPPGSSYGYLSKDLPGGQAALIQVNLSNGVVSRVVDAPAVGRLTASPDGSTLFLNAVPELYAIDVATLTTLNSVAASYNGCTITPDGEYLYCAAVDEVDILSTGNLQVVGVVPAPTTSDQAPSVSVPIMVSR